MQTVAYQQASWSDYIKIRQNRLYDKKYYQGKTKTFINYKSIGTLERNDSSKCMHLTTAPHICEAKAKSHKIERRNKLFNNNRDANPALSKVVEKQGYRIYR